MDLPETTEHSLIFISLGLLVLAFLLVIRLRKTRKVLTQREEEQKQRAYYLLILKEIQDKIGYSLDIEEIVEVIIKSLKHLFPYTSASAVVIKDNKSVFKINLLEGVNRAYVDSVKKTMFDSLSILLGQLPEATDEQILGNRLDYTNPHFPLSFFNIPLLVNNRVVGLINISSIKPNLYSESEMTLLYEIAGQASNAVSRLEEVLETEKGKLVSLIGSLADGVIMIDDKKDVLLVNTAARNFLGVTRELPNFSDLISAVKDKYDLGTKIEECLNHSKAIEDRDVSLAEKDFQIFINPVLGPNHTGNRKPIGISILLHDITLEKDLASVKEDFTNMVVHEIRAPLTAIKTSSELLLEKGDQLTEEEKLEMITIVKQQSKVLLNEVGSVLDASKIEAGRFTLNKSQGDLNKTIVLAIDALLPVAKKKQIGVEMKLADNIPLFNFDQIRITQVINNLFSNSLKFTRPGGKITIHSSVKPGFIVTSVTDTGMGVPKEEQSHLFSKFYQLKKTDEKVAIKGTGIGLYIVKGIVDAHGGNAWVESPASPDLGGEEGKGTTIFFSLPITKTVSMEEEYQKTTLPHVAYKTIN
jgi:signal transduction histidine kinase